jgi:peptide/nickel transport system permease protein
MRDKHVKSSFIKELLTKKPFAWGGLAVLILLVLIAIFADQLAPYPMVGGKMQIDMMDKLASPSHDHLLGTDGLGRDVLSYLIYGARTSVILCLSCCVISVFISVLIGTISAVIGGWFDLILQRFVDAWLCIPPMLIMLILMSMMGNGMIQLIFALSFPSGIGGARMMRSAAIAVKDSGFCKTSDLLGGGVWHKTIIHVVPNILPLIIISLASNLGAVVMMEASMNFLGFGVGAGTPSWGYMIVDQGRANMYLAPWLSLYPGLLIMLMVFASNMLGDGVRDILDPRLKGGVGSYNTDKISKLAVRQLKKWRKHRF